MAKISKNWKNWIKTLAVLVSLVLAFSIAFTSAKVLIVGQKVISVEEVPDGVKPEVTELYIPYPPAIIPLFGSILLIYGLLIKNRLLFAWAGFAVLLIFTLMFIFSLGGELLRTVVPILFLLIFIQVLK